MEPGLISEQMKEKHNKVEQVKAHANLNRPTVKDEHADLKMLEEKHDSLKPEEQEYNGKVPEKDNVYVMQSVSNGKNENEEARVEIISSACWYLPGKIKQIERELLLDFGSTYTILDIDLYNMTSEKERPALKNINLKLRSANGEILKGHGETIVDIMIGNQKLKFSVKVVSLEDKNAIVRLDFMSANDCALYLSKGVFADWLKITKT